MTGYENCPCKFDLSLQKVEPGPGVDDPLATDDLLRVLLLELILLTVMAHIAPHLRLPVEMNLPGALHNIIAARIMISRHPCVEIVILLL